MSSLIVDEDRLFWARTHVGEFLATFIFTFALFGNVLNNAASPASAAIGPMACGFAAYAAVFCFGGHFNPAVTGAAILTRKLAPLPGAIYLAVQLAASFAACALATALFPGSGHADSLLLQPHPEASLAAAFAMELVLTFILVLVVFRAAIGIHVRPRLISPACVETASLASEDEACFQARLADAQHKKHHAGLVIGLTIAFLCCLGGGVSGGAFNPLRVTAPAFLARDFHNLWLYWAADLAGGAAAGTLHLYLYED